MTSLARLRRIPVRPVPQHDAVILAAVVLRCGRCATTWQARLGAFGDEIEPTDTRCPHCVERSPEPPQAA